MIHPRNALRSWCRAALSVVAAGVVPVAMAVAQSGDAPPRSDPSTVAQSLRATLAELKLSGALESSYRTRGEAPANPAPGPDLDTFRRDILPILERSCFECHGPDEQEGEVRIDALDPDLFAGDDVDWWLDVLSVLTNGEMPPEDEGELADGDRSRVIEWLSAESQRASLARRGAKEHSSFRRMARYEYNYALQDLLGLPFDFADALPPDPTSEDGFQNSSDVLHLTGIQFRAYLESARKALAMATVEGERPEPMHWAVSMEAAAVVEWAKQDEQLANLRKKHGEDPEKLEAELERLTARFESRPRGAHYANPITGRRARQTWGYNGARFAWQPSRALAQPPPASGHVAVLPRGQGLIVELGDELPESGWLRVRVRAWREASVAGHAPSLQLQFGWQASNDSSASFEIGGREFVVDAAPDAPRFYQWDVPLSQVYPRNLMRGVTKLGDLPSPSEYLKLVNASLSGADVCLDYVEVTAPCVEEWPPASHRRIFIESRVAGGESAANENAYAREVLEAFMARAWRREVSAAEVERKLELFAQLRPQCGSFRDAVVEVLAVVLSSPHFLYLAEAAAEPTEEALAAAGGGSAARLGDLELATRLSMFLWCSAPDDELRALAARGELQSEEALDAQIQRMLADPKSRRLSEQFVRQWLGLELLDYLHVDRKVYPGFDAALHAAMREEPIAFFHEVLQRDHSVLEFLHSDFAMANERLAQHYGWDGVVGNHFRRVELGAEPTRGGVLTQAGLLAMNSDGKDSHPLKRGIWLLERLLDDPPPPPPPAVPEIDLADPEIAKLTLKQRIENHRNHAACMSCHAKIDPWGIAFENFDAVGAWRTQVQGREVDAVSLLFNRQKLDGVGGLKKFLLEHRQDQFVRALVHKLTTFALGRPLGFEDRAAIDRIAAQTRIAGDGLATMVRAIAHSELFLNP